MMSSSRLVRGTKGRVVIYIALVLVFGMLVYLLHNSEQQLEDLKESSNKCIQQQESLSAQLQVIFEYKSRLEKSLQQEKAEHRLTKDELQAQITEEKQQREKENLESLNKYKALQQQYKLLQSEHEDAAEVCDKLRVEQLQKLEENSKLESALKERKLELEQVQGVHEKDMQDLKAKLLLVQQDRDRLKLQSHGTAAEAQHSLDRILLLEAQVSKLQQNLNDTKQELQSCLHKSPGIKHVISGQSAIPKPVAESPHAMSSSSASPVVIPAGNVLQQPAQAPPAENKASSSILPKVTTPQINQDALLSNDKTANNVVPVPPPQEKQMLPDKTGFIPDETGVGVPPPAEHEDHIIPNQGAFDSGGLIHGADWHKQQQQYNVPPGVVPAPHGYNLNQNQVQEDVAKVANWPWLGNRAYPVQHLPHAVQRQDGQLQRAQEEEEEEGKEIPRHMRNAYDYEKDGQRGDLQLEEGEEEEDDDMDQIDYGVEGGKQAAPKLAAPAHRDGIMVNPK